MGYVAGSGRCRLSGGLPVSGETQPLFGIDLGELRRVRGRDLAIRFGFGAAISAVAGIVGIAFGPLIGGALLAFPAILPATLTLIETEEGTDAAVADVRGSILGAVALELFAVVAYFTTSRMGLAVGLLAALGAWVLVALGLYVVRARMASPGHPHKR